MTVISDIDKDLRAYINDISTLAANITTLGQQMIRNAGNSNGVANSNANANDSLDPAGGKEEMFVSQVKQMVGESSKYTAKVKECISDLETLLTKKKKKLSAAEEK